MEIYFLKVIICSGILYAFYWLFLEREKMHVFKRFYLLAGLAISYLIPLINITIKKPAETINFEEILPVSATSEITQTVVQEAGSFFTFTNLLWLIAFIISLFFLIRFITGLINIYRIVKRNKLTFLDSRTILVNIQKSASPFSFGKYIFINEEEKDERILLHELTHIRQKHWLDNIFMEIMTIVSWMNPMIFLYKRSIKINHEFLADAAVIKHFSNVDHYRLLLVNKVFAQNNVSLASTFHFFTTKKRLLMLHKKTNFKQAIIRAAAVLPIIGVLVFFLSEKVYTQEVNSTKVSKESNLPLNGLKQRNITQQMLDDWINTKDLTIIVDKKKIEKRELKEYSVDEFYSFLPVHFVDVKSKPSDISSSEIHLITKKFYKNFINEEGVTQEEINEWIRLKKIIAANSSKYKGYFDTQEGKNLVNEANDIYTQMTPTQLEEAERLLKNSDNRNNSGATQKEVEEYEKIMKEIVVMEYGRKMIKEIEGKTSRAQAIWQKMTEEQKASVEAFPPSPPLPPPGLTQKEMEEYKALGKKARVGENKYHLNQVDGKRITELYNRMNKEQRKEVAGMNIPPPPPPPAPPTKK